MFFDSKNFKVLEAGVQMSWMDQQLHLQNISNIETPGYKSKNLVFDDVLKTAQSSAEDVPDTIHASVVTDESVSTLQDGNNVDLEKENIEYYKSYVQYSMLLDKINGKFDNYGIVLNSNMN
ncbi:flagellar basal body rod protein FlgB [Scatolibacter rhodanostii]|uniref:flagellar basal body rod protein FlgB n=1 Tax=Scatolibacter rhodanostii TaxID=2014781 RepID=UPI000C071D45|nr:flagellar basal body rod protein FlgB [Scatolibacter rhodanostii]